MNLLIRFVLSVIIGVTLTACPKAKNNHIYSPKLTDDDMKTINVYPNDSINYVTEGNFDIKFFTKFKLDSFQFRDRAEWGSVRDIYHYSQYGAILTSNDSKNYKIQHFVTNRFIHQSYFSISFSKNNSIKKLFGYELLSNLKMINYSIGNEFDSVYFCTTTSNSIDNANSSFDTVFLTSKQGIVGWKFDGEPRWIRND